MALPLIDKQDNFEIVRDTLAALLATEVANQVALATAAGKDPTLWDFGVYEERTVPWEALYNATDEKVTINTPLVNIWYDAGNFPRDKGDTIERQACDGVYNIDCYAAAVSENDRTGTGHTPGDLQAALNVQRIVRLVRNIIMSGENAYLQLRGTVWSRWFQSINVFQPQLSDRPAIHVQAARMALAVRFNEFSPQATPEDLETVFTTVKRTGDGKVVIEAEFDVT
jgi:hypothetical protein